MTSTQQRAELQRRIWAIANDVRGAVDGWDFKQYVLGALFYRFISENFASYIEGGDDSIRYAELPDDAINWEAGTVTITVAKQTKAAQARAMAKGLKEIREARQSAALAAGDAVSYMQWGAAGRDEHAVGADRPARP